MISDTDCKRAKELLHLRLDGELAGADADALTAHLAACENCRTAAEELENIASALSAELAELAPPADLEARIRASVAATVQTVPEPVPQRRTAPMLWAFAAAAAVALALYVGSQMGAGAPPASVSGMLMGTSPAIVARGGESLHVFGEDSNVARPARTGDLLDEDVVAWGVNETTIALEFRGGARLELSREAVVKIGAASITLIKGGLYADLTDVTDSFQVITPWGTVSGDGSAFALISGEQFEAARLLVSAGAVVIDANDSRRHAQAGASVILREDTQHTLVL